MPHYGLYLHIPFCVRKCLYCDFYSLPAKGVHITAYIEALKTELWLRQDPAQGGLPFSTVYIGGGTPSLLRAAQVGEIVQSIAHLPPSSGEREVTMEVNPATTPPLYFAEVAAQGVNRLSIGVQSFLDGELRALGRIHSAAQACATFACARQGGIENINIDLLYGIPGQTLDTLICSIESACDLAPEHISLYGLTIEGNTPLAAAVREGKVTPIDQMMQREMYLLAVEILTGSGYAQYEISNFSKPGRQCAHNLHYWQRGQYVGSGASAHGFINNCRYWNYRYLTQYMGSIAAGRLPVQSEEQLTVSQRMLERLFLSLRMNSGLNVADFNSEFGADFLAEHAETIENLLDEAPPLIALADDQLTLTTHGLLVHDEICRLFA